MLSSASLVIIKQSLPPSLDKKYHCDFLRYWEVKSYPQFLLLPNPVGKIAITSRPASSSFTAVSCFLLRIIFCLSLRTLRRSRALSILNSAESAIFFPYSLSSAPLKYAKDHLTWLTYVWPSTNPFSSHSWCADYSKYGGFLAGSISKASSPLPFFESRLRRQNFNKTTFVTSMS